MPPDMVKIQPDPVKDYEFFIENLASENQNKVFLNSSHVHAAIVMKTIFKHAKNEIKVYASSLNGDVSKDISYQNEVTSFLERGGKLSVLVEDPNTCVEGDMFQIIKHYRFFNPERVKIRTSKVLVMDSRSEKAREIQNEAPIHFTVGDQHSYRKEIDTNNFLAEGNFNDPVEAKKLSDTFDIIFSSSTYSEPFIK